jgi:pimeloyl-ACP methyl ester carboxylesterase
MPFRGGVMTIAILAAAALVALALVPGSTPRISRRLHPNGLAALEPVDVNGNRQWVLIRTEDVHSPVALFVHGGPGTSELGLNRQNTRAIERYFTVVNWDQRGAGKSFAAGRDRGRMTRAQLVDDVVALSTHLAARFQQRKILLIGHSWGSVIGMLAVAKRPDLFHAYIGIGQMSRMAESERLSYEWTVEHAQAAGDQASARKLAEIGPPPYTGAWRSKFMTERRILGKFGGEYWGSRIGAFGVVLRTLLSREYTMRDRVNFFRGIFASLDALFPELYASDLFAEVPEVKVPVWLCLGRHDYEVPNPLSARYFEALRAPRKALVWFENSAHLPNTEESEKFNAFLTDTVLPALSGSE